MYLRELVANYPELRAPILQRLAETVGDIPQSRVLRGCLWVLGEYCEDEESIVNVITAVLTSLKPLPILPAEEAPKDKKDGEKAEKEKKPAAAPKITTQTVVLADGTYGTKTVYEQPEGEEPSEKEVKKSPLRNAIVGGDQLLCAALACALTRLCLRCPGVPQAMKNEVMFVMANLYKTVVSKAGDGRTDGTVRLTQCIRAMVASSGGKLEGNQLAAAQLTQAEWGSGHSRTQLAKVLELASTNSEWTLGAGANEEAEERVVAPDECIIFRQLRERKGGGITEVIDEDMSSARGDSISSQAAKDGELFAERLAKVQQMSGLADPVYVEAFLQVHSFDLVLELLLVNRTQDTLQNVLVELSTQGDLKIVDRPQGVTLAPGQQMMVHASIKVASTETGIIFGYVTFEKKSAADKESE